MLVLAQSKKVLGQSLVVNGTQKGSPEVGYLLPGEQEKKCWQFLFWKQLTLQGGKTALVQAVRGKDSSGVHLGTQPWEVGPMGWPCGSVYMRVLGTLAFHAPSVRKGHCEVRS